MRVEARMKEQENNGRNSSITPSAHGIFAEQKRINKSRNSVHTSEQKIDWKEFSSKYTHIKLEFLDTQIKLTVEICTYHKFVNGHDTNE